MWLWSHFLLMCLFSPLSGRFDHKSVFSLSKPISKSKTNRIGYHISMFKHLHSYLHPPSKWAHNLLGHNVKQAVLLNKCPPHPSIELRATRKTCVYFHFICNFWIITGEYFFSFPVISISMSLQSSFMSVVCSFT